VIAFPSFNDPPNQIATTKVGSGSLLRALVQQYVVADMGGESYHDQWLTDGLTDLAECTVLEQIGLERRCVRLLRRKRVDWMQLLDRSPDELVVGPLWLGERAGVAESARLRGPLLMHRLRVLVGDDDVRILVARVMTAYRGQRLSTRSFLMQAESLLGSDLRPFFLGWVYDTPLDPVVRVETNLVAEDDGTWTLEVSGRLDAQEGRRFRLVAPVTLSMRVDGELLLHSLTVTSRSHTTRIEGLPSIPRRIELDPARTFPGRTSLEKAAR